MSDFLKTSHSETRLLFEFPSVRRQGCEWNAVIGTAEAEENHKIRISHDGRLLFEFDCWTGDLIYDGRGEGDANDQRS